MNKHNFNFFFWFLTCLLGIVIMMDWMHVSFYTLFPMAFTILVMWRRYYLKMKPYWGGYSLKDYKRYFTEP